MCKSIVLCVFTEPHSPQQNFGTFHKSLKKPFTYQQSLPFFLESTQCLATPGLLSVSTESLFLDASYKKNHMTGGLLCLTSVTEHYVFNVLPCCSLCQLFIPFYYWVIFHCKCVYLCMYVCMASLVALGVKNSPTNAKDMRSTCLIPGSGRSPGGQHGEHSWKSHGQRSLAGYSLWACKESNIADHTE